MALVPMKVTVLVGANSAPLPPFPHWHCYIPRQYAIADHRPAGVGVGVLQREGALADFRQSLAAPVDPVTTPDSVKAVPGSATSTVIPPTVVIPRSITFEVTSGIPEGGAIEDQVRWTARRRADGAGGSAGEQRAGL